MKKQSPHDKYSTFHTNSGQSLFEVVVALGVAALVLVGIVSLSTLSLRNTNFSKNNAIATKYAQEGNEFIRQKRDENWDNFMATYTVNCPGTRNLGNNFSTGSANIDSVFSRRICTVCEFYNATTTSTTSCGSGSNANVVDTYIVVSWTDGQGLHEVKSVSTLTRWRN